MTREEAYNELKKQMKVKGEYHHIYAYVEFDQANDLIEKIYEDFENRKCKNCIYSTNSNEGNKYIYCIKLKQDFFNNFGCKLFERKESE